MYTLKPAVVRLQKLMGAKMVVMKPVDIFAKEVQAAAATQETVYQRKESAKIMKDGSIAEVCIST